MHLDVFVGTLQADDGRDRGSERRRERLDARAAAMRLDVLGIDVGAVGEDDHVLLRPRATEAVLVDLAEISRVVPAVFSRTARVASSFSQNP